MHWFEAKRLIEQTAQLLGVTEGQSVAKGRSNNEKGWLDHKKGREI